ncbi:MAG: hypothetical protein QOF78_2253 [Phycisphaerales bacterium]|jgi:uncharacterized membrane protein YhaH (DUF805 family)|nr:hypothetical protein [Phycisphaerales bacterium]
MSETGPTEELKEQLAKLSEELGELRQRIDNCNQLHEQCKKNGDDAKKLLQHERSEAGQWARHYSAVRMTVTPFLFTTSLAILAFASKTRTTFFVWAAIIFWIVGMIVLGAFTYFTRAKMELEKDFRDQLKSPLKQDCTHDTRRSRIRAVYFLVMDVGFVVGLILTLCYLIPVVFIALICPELLYEKNKDAVSTTMPSISVVFPTPMPKLEFAPLEKLPSIQIAPPPEMPTIKFAAPPTLPAIQLNPPATMPSAQVTVTLLQQPTTVQVDAAQPSPLLSIKNNRLDIQVPAKEPRKFHILKLGFLGLDICDIAIPISDERPKSQMKAEKRTRLASEKEK